MSPMATENKSRNKGKYLGCYIPEDEYALLEREVARRQAAAPERTATKTEVVRSLIRTLGASQ